jgi:hypothetical protein
MMIDIEALEPGMRVWRLVPTGRVKAHPMVFDGYHDGSANFFDEEADERYSIWYRSPNGPYWTNLVRDRVFYTLEDTEAALALLNKRAIERAIHTRDRAEARLQRLLEEEGSA